MVFTQTCHCNHTTCIYVAGKIRFQVESVFTQVKLMILILPWF